MERTATSKWMRSMVYTCQAECHKMHVPWNVNSTLTTTCRALQINIILNEGADNDGEGSMELLHNIGFGRFWWQSRSCQELKRHSHQLHLGQTYCPPLQLFGHGWIHGIWQGWASGLENTLLDPTLLAASQCATHWMGLESSFTTVIISTACCFPADLTLTFTATPDTHANKSFVSHAESTFLIVHFTLLTAYTHKLRRCNCSQVPPLVQRFSWSSLTFVL